jgi:hypothetical protein
MVVSLVVKFGCQWFSPRPKGLRTHLVYASLRIISWKCVAWDCAICYLDLNNRHTISSIETPAIKAGLYAKSMSDLLLYRFGRQEALELSANLTLGSSSFKTGGFQ